MYSVEIHQESFPGLKDADYWHAIEGVQQQQLQRTKALRKNLKTIDDLRSQYLSELQSLMGEERWVEYLALREELSLSLQGRLAAESEIMEGKRGSAGGQGRLISDRKQVDELFKEDREAVRELQLRYSELYDQAYRKDRLAMPSDYLIAEPYVARGGQQRLRAPFLWREAYTYVDPPVPSDTKQRVIRTKADHKTGNIRHDSEIHLYDAGNSSHIYIETRIGCAAVFEPHPSVSKIFVKAKYTNMVSCAAWAEWEEWGISSNRQEFTCEAYVRVHQFRLDFPLVGEAVGLEMRDVNQGKTGKLILKTNGTVAIHPPYRSFWLPGDQIETNWVEFEGPWETQSLAIVCGVDICHRADANDYSLFSDLLFNLQLQSIVIEVAP